MIHSERGGQMAKQKKEAAGTAGADPDEDLREALSEQKPEQEAGMGPEPEDEGLGPGEDKAGLTDDDAVKNRDVGAGTERTYVGQVTGRALEEALGLVREPDEDEPTFGQRLTREMEAHVGDEGLHVYETGKRLLLIVAEKLYQEDSFEQFLAGSNVKGWGRSKVLEVMSQVRDFIVGEVFRVPIGRLAKIGWRQVQEIHGLVKEGVVAPDVAFEAAEGASRSDLAKLKTEWWIAYAKSKGLKPMVIHCCQTCVSQRLFDWRDRAAMSEEQVLLVKKYTNVAKGETVEVANKKGEKLETIAGPITIVTQSMNLALQQLVACKVTRRVLAVNRVLTRQEGERIGETCVSYREAI
jgi:hypothetical protein